VLAHEETILDTVLQVHKVVKVDLWQPEPTVSIWMQIPMFQSQKSQQFIICFVVLQLQLVWQVCN
jgi:hypothetical protein